MSILQSAVGRKIFMAITGLLMFLFLVIHMLGNSSLFIGPDGLNAYAEFLHSLGAGVWIFRLVMAVLFIFHVILGIQLTAENRDARPIQYMHKKDLRTTVAAKSMIYTGVVILGFVVYHLLHFTVRITNPEISQGIDAAGRFDVYTMVVLSFENFAIAAVYIIAMFALLFHISHGLSSMLQTLGLNNGPILGTLQKIGYVVAAAIALGYVTFPVSVLLGIVKV
ncbi:succinate dehydrogenase cytochrome b subunit [Chrysiogenes arsenatis]|uniref:succinate dehydrogenase cytochrome b subunit n=1 Tax=Chrysiogenes arsenatis TaxID=309797 RepID=UPI0004164B0A|nr:succinate dehydrogenase cytochrome b subunit [Chrysiogenes arsenatis]